MTTVPKPTSLADTYACAYDAWNRLVEVKSGATVVARYEYDGLSRRSFEAGNRLTLGSGGVYSML